MDQNTVTETAETLDLSWVPSKPLTFHMARRYLAEIVASMPEGHIYQRPGTMGMCLYWHEEDKAPGCIIGRLLARIGAPPQFLKACDSAQPAAGVESLFRHGMLAGVFKDDVPMALSYLQELQDAGQPWSAAVEAMGSYWVGFSAGRAYETSKLGVKPWPPTAQVV